MKKSFLGEVSHAECVSGYFEVHCMPPWFGNVETLKVRNGKLVATNAKGDVMILHNPKGLDPKEAA